MGRLLPLLVLTLLIPSYTLVAVADNGRSVNVDLDVTDISITYPDNANKSLYQMFSSNYPIANFNKPEMLYVTDGVVGVELNLNVVIENLGTVQSGYVDVVVMVLHNEYSRFELLNTSRGMSPISGSSSGSLDILWTPSYSGNHTLTIEVTNALGDDNPSNNLQTRHLTIAYHYDNCVDMTQWTSTGDWNVNSDVSISQSSAFHVGNGQFSSYSASTISTLTSPIFNVADDVSGHNSAIGYSFFYTGGAGSGDEMKGYAKDETGNWDETFTMQNVIDNNFQDGLSWNTFTASYNGKSSPLLPLTNSHFHTTTQLRFTFTSDAVDSDIGYWIDELVIIYDQAAKKKEFQIETSGVSTLGGLPGDWSTTRFEMTNTGNISARYTPSATGIPVNWSHYFAYPTGASIGSTGVELLPGESREFDLRVLIDENASQGNIPVTVNVTSNTYSDVEDGLESVIKILPDRLPDVIRPDPTPRCAPGTTCQFPVSVQNIGEATDVFTLTLEEKNVPVGWNIALSTNQSSSVLVRVDTPAHVWLSATVPLGAEPDVTAEAWLTATSTNDTRRYDTETIEVAAAMTSIAEISFDGQRESEIFLDPGSSHDVSFRIWNNATRIDIFEVDVVFTEISGWSVELLDSPELAISAGSSSTFSVRVTSPTNAQANDLGPRLTPSAISSRSGESITGEDWQGIRVNALRDVSLELLEYPSTLTPGIPIHVSIEVTNNGNGPDTAVIDLPWSPETWEWWALQDGVNVTSGIDLSVSYDLGNVKQVDVWILLPPLESPGEFHEVTLKVSPEDGVDVNDDDNSKMFESVTDTIRQPKLEGYAGENVVETNSTFSFNATAWNIGNAVDSTIRARLVLQTSQSSEDIIGFLSTSNGLSKSNGEWISLNLGPTQSVELFADVIISQNCDLNTIISATIELEGGSDELGRPISKSITAGLLVAERRNVELQEVSALEQDIEPNSEHIIWVNLTSTSTKSEIFDVNAIVPEGWGIICDGNPIHIQNSRVELDSGHIIQQSYDMRCEVVRESGDYSGTYTIFVNGSDSRIDYKISDEISWAEPTSDKSNANIIIASGVVIFAVTIFGVLMYLRRGIDDEDFEDKYEEYENLPAQGPPSTAFSGPPATAEPVADPMLEYQRQLEEYNRKMAEYNEWQQAQGSQVTVESSNHE
ncbi:MAG: hypothetical protein ACPH87_02010 [Candidatus Poseidoniaceae archaeon]